MSQEVNTQEALVSHRPIAQTNIGGERKLVLMSRLHPELLKYLVDITANDATS